MSDYIDRTIATVRNHRDADNCWPQWANVLADEIEQLRALLLACDRQRREAERVSVTFYDEVERAEKIDTNAGDSAVSVALWGWAERRAALSSADTQAAQKESE